MDQPMTWRENKSITTLRSKRRLRTPLDAGSSKELQQVALAAVDLVDERLI